MQQRPQNSGWKTAVEPERLRHGLAVPLGYHSHMTEVIKMIAQTSTEMTESSQMVHAIFDLARIRGVRRAMLSVPEPERGDPVFLKRLMAVDRYEWRALAKRRRAENEL